MAERPPSDAPRILHVNEATAPGWYRVPAGHIWKWTGNSWEKPPPGIPRQRVGHHEERHGS